MRAMFKKYIPPAVYAIANCAPIPPIMGINILALFSKKTYTSKTTVISTLLYIAVTLPFIAIHLKNGVESSEEEFQEHMYGKHNSYIMQHFFKRPISHDEIGRAHV